MGNTQEYIDINSAIVERLKKGDKKAFQELYNLYVKNMLNISVRILNNTEEAKEAVQDSFLKAFENIEKYDKKYSFGVWLKRIVINHSLNILKKRKVVFVPIENSNYVADEAEQEDQEIKYDVETVRVCIQELSDGYRTIFTLFLFEKYSHKEIAELLNISEGTSRSQYTRAKRKLIELVKQKMINNGK